MTMPAQRKATSADTTMTRTDVVRLLREGGNPEQLDVSNHDMNGNLRGANLSQASVCEASLRGANLDWATLYGAFLGRADAPGTLRSEGTQLASPPAPTRLRRRSLSRALLYYAAMLLILGAGWFVGLRPYLHGLAQNQIDTLLSNVVNQLDLAQIPGISFVPLSIPVTERTVNNLFVLYASPSDPVQHMHMQITPGGLRVDFQVYGFACDITGVPVVSNGQLIVANVTVEGIVSLIMSSDEMTSILNAHLRDARAKLHRNVVGVILKDHEIDIILG